MDINDFVGIPYKLDGRSFEGADCWGLVWLYYKYILGLEIECYANAAAMTEGDRKALSDLIANEIDDPWIAVDLPKRGDLVLIRWGREVFHVGVCVGADKVLHSPGPDTSIIERLSSPIMKRRVDCFLRHKDMI